MPVGVLDAANIRNRREVIERRLVVIKRALKVEESNLEELYKLCLHPDKQRQWDDSRGSYWLL